MLAVVILEQLIKDGTNILSTFEVSEICSVVDSTELMPAATFLWT